MSHLQPYFKRQQLNGKRPLGLNIAVDSPPPASDPCSSHTKEVLDKELEIPVTKSSTSLLHPRNKTEEVYDVKTEALKRSMNTGGEPKWLYNGVPLDIVPPAFGKTVREYRKDVKETHSDFVKKPLKLLSHGEAKFETIKNVATRLQNKKEAGNNIAFFFKQIEATGRQRSQMMSTARESTSSSANRRRSNKEEQRRQQSPMMSTARESTSSSRRRRANKEEQTRFVREAVLQRSRQHLSTELPCIQGNQTPSFFETEREILLQTRGANVKQKNKEAAGPTQAAEAEKNVKSEITDIKTMFKQLIDRFDKTDQKMQEIENHRSRKTKKLTSTASASSCWIGNKLVKFKQKHSSSEKQADQNSTRGHISRNSKQRKEFIKHSGSSAYRAQNTQKANAENKQTHKMRNEIDIPKMREVKPTNNKNKERNVIPSTSSKNSTTACRLNTQTKTNSYNNPTRESKKTMTSHNSSTNARKKTSLTESIAQNNNLGNSYCLRQTINGTTKTIITSEKATEIKFKSVEKVELEKSDRATVSRVTSQAQRVKNENKIVYKSMTHADSSSNVINSVKIVVAPPGFPQMQEIQSDFLKNNLQTFKDVLTIKTHEKPKDQVINFYSFSPSEDDVLMSAHLATNEVFQTQVAWEKHMNKTDELPQPIATRAITPEAISTHQKDGHQPIKICSPGTYTEPKFIHSLDVLFPYQKDLVCKILHLLQTSHTTCFTNFYSTPPRTTRIYNNSLLRPPGEPPPVIN